MNLIASPGGDPQMTVLLAARDELYMMHAALRETLECLDEWEFDARTGFSKEEFRRTLMALGGLLRESE